MKPGVGQFKSRTLSKVLSCSPTALASHNLSVLTERVLGINFLGHIAVRAPPSAPPSQTSYPALVSLQALLLPLYCHCHCSTGSFTSAVVVEQSAVRSIALPCL